MGSYSVSGINFVALSRVMMSHTRPYGNFMWSLEPTSSSGGLDVLRQ